MSITIGRIDNKFGSNSDWKFPNSFPVYADEKVLKDDEPHMNDFFSGTIYLYGKNWNHCFYKGAYYALQIFQTIDEDREYYVYRLEREGGFDILINRPRVIGDLGNSNNDTLLEQNLSRTISVLDNPARIVTINFGDIEQDWTKTFTFKTSNKDIEQVVLSKDGLNAFLRGADGENVKNGRKIDKKYYSTEQNGSAFIFCWLEGSVTRDGGKNRLRKRINDFVESIPANKDNLKLSKVKTPENFKLIGNYCITHKVDGISDTEEAVMLERIDLSGLKDIVPLNFHDLTELEPYKPIGEGFSSGVFDIPVTDVPKFDFLSKIRRTPHLPLTSSRPKIGSMPIKSKTSGSVGKEILNIFTFNGFDIEGHRYISFPMYGEDNPFFCYNGDIKDPQEIDGSYKGKDGKFYSWWIDNLNFLLSFSGIRPGSEWNSRFTYDADFRGGRRGYGKNTNINAPYPGVHHYYRHPTLVKKYNVPFGFLIFGLEREFDRWRLFEYKDQQSRREVYYFSGIRNKLLDEYRKEGKGGSTLTENIKLIQPSEEFIKFYLDNFYLTGLSFFTSTGYIGHASTFGGTYESEYPGFDEDMGGVFPYVYSHYTDVDRILKSYIHNPVTREKAAPNPFNDELFPNYRRLVDANLGNLLLRSKLDFPENLTLEKGDGFFSDDEYSIDSYFPLPLGERILDAVTYFDYDPANRHLGGRLEAECVSAFRLEDFISTKVDKKGIFKPGDKRVILCSNLDGDIEVRTLEVFDARQRLLEGEDQIVKAVDGSDHRVSKFTLIKKIRTFSEKDEEFQGVTNDLKEAVIHAFYKVHGYKTKINKGVAHGNGFQDSDFAPESNSQLLFDLVGTDGGCFCAKGKISLIAKNKGLFYAARGKSKGLLHAENEGLNLSLVEKVNQKVRLQFLSAPYYLNGKTTFTDKDRISLSFETLTPVDLPTQFDQYFIKLDTGFDQIYYENIAVPKKQTKSLSLADSVTLERLNLEMVRDQYSYQIDQNKLKLATDRYEENIRRAQAQLDHQRLESYLTLGIGSFTGSAATGIATKYSKEKKVINTKGGGQPGGKDSETLTMTTTKKGLQRMIKTNKLPTQNVTETIKYGKFPNLAAAGVMYTGTGIKNLIMNLGFRFPERQRQINVEKQLGAADLAIQGLTMNTSHMERQLNAQLAINQVSNVYDNPIINERAVIEQFMKKSEWHGGKQLNSAYLMVFIPSDEQLVQLRSYKEEYGVMCDIPDVEINFYDGMPADVIRYRNLDDASITGIDNPMIREAFRARLLAGLKIIQTSTYQYRLLTSEEYRERIYRLNNDLYEKTNEAKAKESENVKLIHRLNTVESELTTKHETERGKLNEKIQSIENELNEVNTQLRQKIEELNNSKKKCEDDTFKLNEEISKKKEQNEELEQKLNDERRLVLQKIDEVNSLKSQKENLENQKSDIERQLREALEAKTKIEKDGEEARKVGGKKKEEVLDCALLKQILDNRYEIDLKKRDNGWSAFRDLVAEVVEGLIGMRRSGLDAKLMKYESMKQIIKTLNEFELIPYVDKVEDALKQHGGDKYKQGLVSGGDSNGEVDEIIKRLNLVVNLENNASAHAVKVTLDELNYLTGKAKDELKSELNTDTDLQFLFEHVYPGKTLDLYKAVFGDPNLGLMRRRFYDDITCLPAGQGEDIITLLNKYKKETNYQTTDIPKSGSERTIIPPSAGEPGVKRQKRSLVIKGGRSTDTALTTRLLRDHEIFDFFQDRVKESAKGWTRTNRSGTTIGYINDPGGAGIYSPISYFCLGNYPYMKSNKKTAGINFYSKYGILLISEVYAYKPSNDPRLCFRSFKEAIKLMSQLTFPDGVLTKGKSGQLTLNLSFLMGMTENETNFRTTRVWRRYKEGQEGTQLGDGFLDVLRILLIMNFHRAYPTKAKDDKTYNVIVHTGKNGAESIKSIQNSINNSYFNDPNKDYINLDLGWTKVSEQSNIEYVLSIADLDPDNEKESIPHIYETGFWEAPMAKFLIGLYDALK